MDNWLDEYQITAIAQLAGLPTGLPTPAVVVGVIINTLLSLVGVVILVMIIYAGWLWLTSLGNEQKILRAKKVLSSSVIGLAIILSSYSLVAFVLSALSHASGN
jgi:hypothetical protein